MKNFKIYVDTSVIGGCFDPEFSEFSKALFADFSAGRFTAVVSELVAAEILPSPEMVRHKYRELVTIPSCIVLPITDEALELRDRYAGKGVLGERFLNDMLHIALASLTEVDVLVSWNFKHIVRLDKIRLFNSVNLEQGLKLLQIYSPREVISYGEE